MKTLYRIFIASLACIILVSCGKVGNSPGNGKDAKADSEEKEVVTEIPVKVATAERGEISSFLEFDSILETESAVEIFPESTGLVVEVLAEVGDAVEAGQIIAQLENEEEQVNVKESLSRYQHLQSKFQRTQDLFDRSLINQQEYDTELFDLEQAEINYERSRIRLEDTKVRAPVSGVISKRLTQEGERVSGSNALFSLLNMDELFAQVNIPGQHMLHIQKGLRSEIVSEIIEGVSYDAEVKLVSPAIDSASGTFNVKVAVDHNSATPIYPGMFVTVRIVLDTKPDAVIIPKAAIVHEGEKMYIYKVKDAIAEKTEFHPGYANSDRIESLNGLDEGESIIVLGHNALKDGAKVKIVDDSLSVRNAETSSQSRPSEG